MFAVPEALGVKLAWQLAVPRVVPALRVQGELVKLPEAPVAVNVMVPAGLTEVPVFDGLSVTVAVHVVAKANGSGFGLQETIVIVGATAGIAKFASSVTFVDPGVDMPDPKNPSRVFWLMVKWSTPLA